MMKYYEINDGASVPNNNTQAYKELIISRLIELGLYVFDGDPTTNGCTFNFGDFTYTPSSSASYDSFMLTIVHPENNNLCIVIAYLAGLTLTSFTGGTSQVNIAVYSHDTTGDLVFNKQQYSPSSFGYYSYLWTVNTLQCKSIIFSEGLAVVISTLTSGWIYGVSCSLFTNNLVAIQLANVAPTDPHVLVINKPIAEYGVALIIFPSLDLIRGSRVSQFLLQGKTYYAINFKSREASLYSTSTSTPSIYTTFICIY